MAEQIRLTSVPASWPAQLLQMFLAVNFFCVCFTHNPPFFSTDLVNDFENEQDMMALDWT